MNMAMLGFRTIDEMVGRTDLLEMKEELAGIKARVDLSTILNNPYANTKQKVTFDPKQIFDF